MRSNTGIVQRVMFAAGVLCLSGCFEKKIDVTFTNLTDERMDVHLSGPGKGTGVVGTLKGKYDRVHTQLKVPPDELPAQYSWTAGEKYSGRFSIPSQRKIPPRFIDVGGTNSPAGTKPLQN